MSKKKKIPNIESRANDLCLDSIAVVLPLVIYDNGVDCLWFPDALDNGSADRLVLGMTAGGKVEAVRVDLLVILPSASVVRAATAQLHMLSCEPMRLQLLAG